MSVRRVHTRRSVDWRTLVTAGWTGLAQTLFAPPATRPWRSAWLRRLASLAAIAGGVIVALTALRLVQITSGVQTGSLAGPGVAQNQTHFVLIGFLGLLLAAPRFPLITWRLGLLAAVLVTLTVEDVAGIKGGQFALLVLIFCVAAATVERTVLWWMCTLTVALSWLWLPLGRPIRPLEQTVAVSYTHLTLPTICSV